MGQDPPHRAGLRRRYVVRGVRSLSKRESKSRPTQGIVSARTVGKKADGTVVITYERTFLVPKRGHAVDDLAGY